MSSITSNQEQWSKKLSALIDYWNDLNNKFKLPKHFKDADSGLSWRFYNTYVTHFNTVANVSKRKELSKAIANAKPKQVSVYICRPLLLVVDVAYQQHMTSLLVVFVIGDLLLTIFGKRGTIS